jgi:hypothetical protein
MKNELNQTREEMKKLKLGTQHSFKNMTKEMEEMQTENKQTINAVKLDQNETLESFINVQKQILARLNINNTQKHKSSGTATSYDPNTSCTIARKSAVAGR